MNIILPLIIFTLTFKGGYGSPQFQADVTITGDQSIPNGILRGHMNYFYNDTLGAVNHIMSISYTNPVVMTELWNYKDSQHYRYCQQCYAETYKLPIDKYFLMVSDQISSPTIGPCQEYTRSNDVITNIWVNKTDTQRVCKVKTLTREIIFSNYQTQAVFPNYVNWGCPSPTCNQVIDIMLVIDESTSINSAEWTSTINFASALVNNFKIASDGVTMGVVYFATKARVISYLSNSKQSIINAIKTSQKGGSTCIGCGMSMALSLWKYPVAGRLSLNPSRVMIVITDGANNVPTPQTSANTNLTNSAANVHNADVLTFAIGVGTSTVPSELRIIATMLPGYETVINVNNFASLNSIINKLTLQTCVELPSQPCGSSCYGFCSCNQTCGCPECQDFGKCWNNKCTQTGTSTSGCIKTAVNCDDQDACTIDTCNDLTGCIHTPIVLDTSNPCVDTLCSPSSGPYSVVHTCDDHNLCTLNQCDPMISGGCVYQDTCDDYNMCTIDQCDPLTGCFYQSVNCDDDDACTIDTCDVDIGCISSPLVCVAPNSCQSVDYCDTKAGCIFKPIDCNDNDPCTQDLCNTTIGCVHNPIPCSGCIKHPLICESDDCYGGYCADGPNETSFCMYTNKCDSMNPCVLDSCSPFNRTCTHTKKTCTKVPCHETSCNKVTGKCDIIERDCTQGDPCWVGYCDDDTDSCKRDPFCADKPCQHVVCDLSTDLPVCQYQPYNCTSNSKCIIGYCDDLLNACQYVDVSCDDSNMCTNDICDPVKGCTYKNVTCDDGVPCTIDTCDLSKGCQHTPKCYDGLFCTDDNCLIDGTCVNTAIQCDFNLDLTSNQSSCFTSFCSENKKMCLRRFSETAIVDVCGGCMNVIDTNVTSTDCLSSWSNTQLAVTLGAAAIAGIVVAAVIGSVVLIASGAFGTSELIKRVNQSKTTSVTSNPLYKDSDNMLTNINYVGRD